MKRNFSQIMAVVPRRLMSATRRANTKIISVRLAILLVGSVFIGSSLIGSQAVSAAITSMHGSTVAGQQFLTSDMIMRADKLARQKAEQKKATEAAAAAAEAAAKLQAPMSSGASSSRTTSGSAYSDYWWLQQDWSRKPVGILVSMTHATMDGNVVGDQCGIFASRIFILTSDRVTSRTITIRYSAQFDGEDTPFAQGETTVTLLPRQDYYFQQSIVFPRTYQTGTVTVDMVDSDLAYKFGTLAEENTDTFVCY